MVKRISIIIATYNAESTLKRCLDSIVCQLNDHCELIIIDGGSTDRTNEIISSYSSYIAYSISEKDKGIYDAWNKGIKASNGEWIAFVGADDILLPHALENYLSFMDSTPVVDTYDYICAHVEYINQSGQLIKIIGEEPSWKTMRKRMAPAHVASLHNKMNLFCTVGLYDFKHFRICADYELLLRKRDKLKYCQLPINVAQMQVGGMSFSTPAIWEAFLIRKKHHSVPFFVNIMLLVSNWLAFKSFFIRKRMSNSITGKH